MAIVLGRAVAKVCVGAMVSAGTQPTDGKVKGRPSRRRKWLVVLGILTPRAHGPAIAFQYFLKDFNASSAIAARKRWICGHAGA